MVIICSLITHRLSSLRQSQWTRSLANPLPTNVMPDIGRVGEGEGFSQLVLGKKMVTGDCLVRREAGDVICDMSKKFRNLLPDFSRTSSPERQTAAFKPRQVFLSFPPSGFHRYLSRSERDICLKWPHSAFDSGIQGQH